jgi:5,10-methylenetetrahydromethanopterin reductase
MALLDEASHGRAYLGLARGAWLEWLGIEPARPIRALCEAFACIRHLLRRATAPYTGDIFTLAGSDSLRWHILRAEIPFLLGSWGAQTIHACAPYIAEVKVGGTANPALLRHIVAVVRDAAVRAGRHADAIQVVVGAVTVVDRDGERARAWARRHVATYLPVIMPLDHTLALEPALRQRLSAAAACDADQVAQDISDDLLRCVAFAGTPEQVAEQAHALFAVGAARVEFGTPHGVTEEDGMRWLGEAVLPVLRRAV